MEKFDWLTRDIERDDIARKSFTGFAFTFFIQALKFLVTISATAALARLLTPDDFGLIALALSVTGVAYIFTDLGLSVALVQRPRVTLEEVNCLFWLTTTIGFLTALAVSLAGPVLATYLNDSRLTWVIPAIALTFLFGALGSLHQALLRRRMRFGVIGSIELFSGASGYLLAIGLARFGCRYWALVFAQVATFALISLFSWIMCPWRPQRIAWAPSTRTMLRFGGQLTASNLLSYLCRNLDNILIGRFCGATSLGLYSRAYQLLLLPIWQINIPMLGVMTPALSRLQADRRQFKQLYLKAIASIVTLGMPLVVFMFVRAEPIILIALGKRWVGSVLLFRLLAPAAFVDTFNIAAGLIFNPLGQTGRQLRLSVVSAFAILLAICVGIRWGAPGVAIGLSVVTCIIRVPAYRYVYAKSPLKLNDLLAVLWRPAICSLIAGAAVYMVPINTAVATSTLGMLVVRDGFVFIACFLLAFLLFPGGAAAGGDIITLIKTLVSRSKKEHVTDGGVDGP